MGLGDPFEHDDAAYLLGALPAPQRQAYERHLTTCAACRARVDSLRPIISELDRLQAEEAAAVTSVADEPSEAADEGLPRLLDAVGRQRRRRAWAVRGLGGLAAAAIAALIVMVSIPGSPASDQPELKDPQAMTTLVPTPVAAEVSLRQTAWGTEVRLQCRYRATGYSGSQVYDLVVLDRAGQRHELGSWTLSTGERATFSSPVALSPDAIRLVQLTSAEGTPILQMAP